MKLVKYNEYLASSVGTDGLVLWELGQYYVCWCPDSLHHHAISSHDIDLV